MQAVKIIGADEVKHENGDISWKSPVARALLSKEVGDTLGHTYARRQDEFEVLAITFG